jgi:lysophospholipase L1-like esterase
MFQEAHVTRPAFASSVVAVLIGLAACGGTSNAVTGSSAATGSGGSTTHASTGAGGTNAGTGGATGTGGSTGMGIAGVKTLVILGDSISDGGGQPPFYYDLLQTNDDTKYPEWKGMDLKTKYGSSLAVVKNSKAGSVSADLPGQVHTLPATLAGPVVVVITIGGNDMQANIVSILQGTDQSARTMFQMNLSTAFTELTMPGRFGAGVDVHVFEADIYDPTDGTGDFSSCPAPLNFVPKTPTNGFFGNWNMVVDTEVPKHALSLPEPLHTTFHGHGITNIPQNWFYSDCIHPNAKGHDAIRGMFWKAITGETGPAPM